jgi:hypothetical protein
MGIIKTVLKAGDKAIKAGQKLYNNTPVGSVLSLGGRDVSRKITKYGTKLANKWGASNAAGTLGERIALETTGQLGNLAHVGGLAAGGGLYSGAAGAAMEKFNPSEEYVSPTGETADPDDLANDDEFQKFKNQIIYGRAITDDEFDQLVISGEKIPIKNFDAYQQFFTTEVNEDGRPVITPKDDLIRYWTDVKDAGENIYNGEGGWLSNFSLDPTDLLPKKVGGYRVMPNGSLSEMITNGLAGGSPADFTRDPAVQEVLSKAQLQRDFEERYRGDYDFGLLREGERVQLQNPFAERSTEGMSVTRGSNRMLDAMDKPVDDGMIHDEDYDTLVNLRNDEGNDNTQQIADIVRSRPELLQYFSPSVAASIADQVGGAEGRNQILGKAGYSGFDAYAPAATPARTPYGSPSFAPSATSGRLSPAIAPTATPAAPAPAAGPAPTPAAPAPAAGPAPAPVAPTAAGSGYGPTRFSPGGPSATTGATPAAPSTAATPAAVVAAAASPSSAVMPPALLARPAGGASAAGTAAPIVNFGAARFSSNAGRATAAAGTTPPPAGTKPPAGTAPAQKSPVDYRAQRYGSMTQDQMNTAYMNDVFKRRMGYTSKPMDAQLSAFGDAYGMDEGSMNAAMDRHYAGAKANAGPYARAVKPANWDSTYGEWDQTEQDMAQLVRRGVARPEEVMGLPSTAMYGGKQTRVGPLSLNLPDATNLEQQYRNQAARTGIFDSRELARVRGVQSQINQGQQDVADLNKTFDPLINIFKKTR